jgi:hypothetical protein
VLSLRRKVLVEGFKLVFSVLRLADKTAPDPGFARLHLDDDAEHGDAFLPVFAYGGGVPGMVCQQ